jgi:hypothetical protein
MFLSSDEGRETSTLLGSSERADFQLDQWLKSALFEGPNILGGSLFSPEDGNRCSFRNIVFSSQFSSLYLVFRTMDNVKKPKPAFWVSVLFKFYE